MALPRDTCGGDHLEELRRGTLKFFDKPSARLPAQTHATGWPALSGARRTVAGDDSFPNSSAPLCCLSKLDDAGHRKTLGAAGTALGHTNDKALFRGKMEKGSVDNFLGLGGRPLDWMDRFEDLTKVT